MVRAFLGMLAGVAVCYFFGVVVAWDFNPGHWGTFLRIWCALWAIVWGCTGATICGTT